MPIFEYDDISRESSQAYYDGLKQIRNNPNNKILEQLKNYQYERNILNFFEPMKEFDVEIKIIDSAKNYYFVKKNSLNDTAILVIHGGGYVLPVSQNNIHGAMLYSKYAGDIDVLVPDYTVTSQGSHNKAIENVYCSYEYLRSKYKNVILAGQSAGSNLALGLLEYLKDKKVEMPKCVILASPWCDLSCKLESYKDNMNDDIVFGNNMGEVLINPYKENDKYLFPLEFDMSEYPPIMINVAKTEMLLSDSKELYKKLNQDKSELHLYSLMWHDFYTHNDTLKECYECWVRIGKFIRKNL